MIKGEVLGRAGTDETFGFFAQTIGAFKYNGVTVPIKAGASNDRFADNLAHALGPSRSTTNADGFAVHVFEVCKQFLSPP